ncbi:hypothetical protein XF35_11625 [Streptomyces platensis subsp. clarensis]|nr:hypothetical protein [Streptomyces platensis subsp. clarensis]
MAAQRATAVKREAERRNPLSGEENAVQRGGRGGTRPGSGEVPAGRPPARRSWPRQTRTGRIHALLQLRGHPRFG